MAANADALKEAQGTAAQWKSAAKEGQHSFLQSFASDQMSARKSVIENPYSSFISLQSEYFDTKTKVCTIQNEPPENVQQKIGQE